MLNIQQAYEYASHITSYQYVKTNQYQCQHRWPIRLGDVNSAIQWHTAVAYLQKWQTEKNSSFLSPSLIVWQPNAKIC